MIYLTGDTHGQLDLEKFTVAKWAEQTKLNKDDYLIILGDAAIRWYDTKPDGSLCAADQELVDFYNTMPWTTLFIDGNHENHHALAEYPITEWNGGKVHKISDSIYHLMRGQVFEIDGKTFFTMGGATSMDRYARKENISWWEEEMPSKEELEEGISNLEKHNMEVDYVLTHCCGSSLIPILLPFGGDSDTLTNYFDHLEFNFGLKFKHWYFGHYHRDRQIDDKYTCLYNLVERLDESTN